MSEPASGGGGAFVDDDVATIASPEALRGTIDVPGDKSVTHRAIMFNAVASGDARIDAWLDAADTRSTLACMRALGAEVHEEQDGSLLIKGRGRAALHDPAAILDCGNSGTTMRLLSGLLAGLPLFAVLTGDASLSQRPMGRVIGPLRELGATALARADGTLPPIAIRGGGIRGGQRIEIPVASAQVKSALLLAGLAADGPTTVVEPAPSRDHTERMLSAMGARIEVESLSGGAQAVTLTPPPGDLAAIDVRVPGDISTAAAWIVAATIHPDADLLLTNVGVNPSRTGILDILGAMGASIELIEERTVGGEPIADLRVRSARLRGTRIDGSLVPRAIDELPLIALAAAFADGETVIADATELRVKESDRVATTANVLGAFGIDIEARDDGLRVRGEGSARRLAGARVDSAGDHRVAMLGAVAGLVASGETRVQGAGAVAVSYPLFWTNIERIGAVPRPVRG